VLPARPGPVRRLRQPAGGALGQAHRAAEAREDHLGARVLGLLGDRKGDALAREHPGDQQALALEDHSGITSSLPRSAPTGERRQSISTRARATVRPRWVTIFHCASTRPCWSSTGLSDSMRPSTWIVSPLFARGLKTPSAT